ncbi:MAG TPA: DUF885 domain-containing protein [Candidatus Acidoferrales bacterium]|nr:DUF885 domain-containing protein [Candidatus Acidoferrales bacterium]
MNDRLRAAIDDYEAANCDERGPLRGAAFTAVYRASQGMPVSHIAPETEALNDAAAGWCETMLARLEAFDAAALSEQDRVSLAILRLAIERRLEGTRYYWHAVSVTPYRSFVTAFQTVFRSFAIDGEDARARYLAAIRDVGGYARAAREKLEGQVARGIVLPRRVLGPIVATHRAAANVENSPFLAAAKRPEAASESVRERFLADACDALRAHVVPAVERLVEYLEGAYAAAASSQWGQSALPGGNAYYRYAVRANTTLELSPEDIHATGLQTVAELREAMAALRSRVGFTGTAAEFHAKLRTDPRFVPQTPEEIGDRLERFARLADGALDRFFLRRPKAPFAAKRLPADLEAGMTFGYYHPGARTGETGHYFFNGSNLPERSLLSVASLALHELVPGHHYEINVARENPELPRFRAFAAISTYIAAYHEGWAEYAADLGKEFGAYEDPYDLYGRHALDAFISSRLVVDTGMNALGWSYQRAEAFLRENTLLSETEIASELPRYATDLPGQGLAYKLGALTFARLRDETRAKLGSAFDARAFHDKIVTNGGMPLTLVESEMARFADRAT